jgi:hypothetical protein
MTELTQAGLIKQIEQLVVPYWQLPLVSLSNRLSHGFPPGWSKLFMPGRLRSQQDKSAVAFGNRCAATIPYDRLTSGCTGIETHDQGG